MSTQQTNFEFNPDLQYLLVVDTDKSDYAPGETATFTLTGVSSGGTVKLQVLHVSDPGADGAYGTIDDVLDAGPDQVLNTEDDGYGTTGQGHDLFVVTDGGAGDLDGVANGIVETDWYVNPDDSLDETFIVLAQEASAGADGVYGVNPDTGVNDDVASSAVATTSFTDALPPPIQTYFVPLPETPLLNNTFETINPPDVNGPVNTLISIAVAAPGTIVYYDHWEDGYEADVTNPGQSTTLIWGDGNAANGVAPGTGGTDIFAGGESIVLENQVPIPRDPTNILFDGADKIQASFPIAVTRGAFPEAPGSLLAGAVEVFDTDAWGDSFIVPVGQNTSSGSSAFEYTAVYVMAGQNDTDVTVNGTTVTLDAGENTVVRVNQGNTVTSDKPVQVDLVTGDIGSTYELRWYALTPTEDWSNDYYTPVGDSAGGGGNGPTQVWLYNPGASAITVSYDFLGGSSPDGTINVAAGGTALSPAIPDGSGARFFTAGGEDFFALTQTDTNLGDFSSGQIYDWGHPLLSADQLTSQALIGWGYGNTSNDPTVASRSVVWVTPVADATINIDFNGDGSVDNTVSATALSSTKILDDSSVYSGAENDQDMSGAIIFATDSNGDPVDIAVAWGQDPELSGSGDGNALDLGTVVPPLPILEAGKSASLADDKDGDGEFDPGDTIEWTITVQNIGRITLPAGGYNVEDFVTPVFDNASYIADTTTYTTQNFTDQLIPDDAGPNNGFPLDGAGFTSTVSLLANGGTHTFKFQTLIVDFADLDPGTVDITNTGEATNNNDGKIDDFSATVPLDFDAAIDIEKATNGEDADDPTGPVIPQGSTVTWTYEVTNTGTVWLDNIAVTDNQLGPVTNRIDDGDGDAYLQPGETWIYEATGTAELGQYANTGTATGDPVYNDGTPVDGVDSPTDSDLSHYLGIEPINVDVEIVKQTNGLDNQNPTIAEGGMVTWTYLVTNQGNIDINEADLNVSDSEEGAVTIIIDKGDGDGVLAQGETWTYQLTGIAQTGPYTNTGTVEASATDEFGNTGSDTDSEDDGYTGVNVDVEIVKKTNGLDNANATVPIGSPVTWTYEVTNNGDIGIAEADVSVSDSVEGPVTTIIDKGNGDATLDVGETWTYELTGTAQAGVYTNTGTVEASFTDEFGNTDSDSDSEDDGYTGANPAINIDKVTSDGISVGDGITVSPDAPITWIYTVTNTGEISLANVNVTDNQTGVTPVLDEDASIGEEDGILDLDDVWIYKATGTAVEGIYSNTGTATGEFAEVIVTDSDDSSYFGIEAPGVRTPGFWTNNKWMKFWDGIEDNEPKQSEEPNFPDGDLLFPPYTNSENPPNVIDPVTGEENIGLLVGDYNRNGKTDEGENTLFYTLEEAEDILDAKNNVGGQNSGLILGRATLASWLNFLAGNPIESSEDSPEAMDPKFYIDEAINWLQATTPDENDDGLGDGDLRLDDAYNVPSSSPYWTDGIDELVEPWDDNDAVELPILAGEDIKDALDSYNNTGGLDNGVDGFFQYAPDGDALI